MICASCGDPVAENEAYSSARGGPWHRLCIPPNPNTLEQMMARAAALRDPKLIGFSFPVYLEDGTLVHATGKTHH